MVISPQRDKTRQTSDEVDRTAPVTLSQESPQERHTEDHNEETEPTETASMGYKESEQGENQDTTDSAEVPSDPEIPNDTNEDAEMETVEQTSPEDIPHARESENTEEQYHKEDDPESKEVASIPPADGQPKLKSSLRNAYVNIARQAVNLPTPAPIIPKWEAHRFACMFDIKMPKDKSKRTEYIATELNKMMDCLREYSKVYVRKYSEFHMPRHTDKTSWISKFDKKKVSDLTSYTFGFYYYQALRDGTFRLLIQLILPVGTNIPDLLINANGHKWAGKNNRSIRDIREQKFTFP